MQGTAWTLGALGCTAPAETLLSLDRMADELHRIVMASRTTPTSLWELPRPHRLTEATLDRLVAVTQELREATRAYAADWTREMVADGQLREPRPEATVIS